MNSPTPNDLNAYWMPFTSNRAFKEAPTMFTGARGMHYYDAQGRAYLDAIAGLWCCNAGHAHPIIVEAIRKQIAELDFVSGFGLGHPAAFDYANQLAAIAPDGLDNVFFTNSGSEAVDTALKIALAYHLARGQGQRQRIIGRARGYHGMGFGGLAAAGMGAHKRQFGTLVPGAAHLPHTHDPVRNAFSRGQPDHGAEAADALLEMIATYDASTIAAVIIEPVAGSTGVLPPPRGYLERLRDITRVHGILLIFDEVVTGFGRLGTAFAADRFGVTPDIITIAKGMTNGAVPMGGAIVHRDIYSAVTEAAAYGAPELSHGYTYSGHPMAVAAGLATLEAYRTDGIWDNAAGMEPLWEEAAHSLRDLPIVSDIRTCGLLAGIELGESVEVGKPMVKRVYEACLERGILVRPVANTIVLSPPLIISEMDIQNLFGVLRDEIGVIA